jgi:hypothetical protein
MATDFTPTRHGFHFTNSFTNPVVTLPGIGTINTYGLCGGMSFASLDYYHAGSPVPTHGPHDFPGGSVPPVGSRLYQYLFDRQLASFNPLVNPSVHKFITMVVPIGRTTYEVTVQDEWPLVRAALDTGQPQPLGLIAQAINPTKSHQVVATGYETSPKQIHIYDCNYPDTADTLELDDAAQVVHESTGDTWAGLFLEQYSAESPTYHDIRLSLGIGTLPAGSATLGDIVEAGFRIRNDGDFTAHVASLDASVRGPQGEDLDSTFFSDGVVAALSPGSVRNYLSQTTAFGTTSGLYEVIAWFKTRENEWFPVPAGATGTSTTVELPAS